MPRTIIVRYICTYLLVALLPHLARSGDRAVLSDNTADRNGMHGIVVHRTNRVLVRGNRAWGSGVASRSLESRRVRRPVLLR